MEAILLFTKLLSTEQITRVTRVHDTIEEFNVDSYADCDQLNLAHVARNKKYKKKIKVPYASSA